MFNSLATKHACCACVIALGLVSFAWLGTFPGAAQSKKEKRVTSVRLGKGSEGSRVTVVSDSALTDYEAYRRGDRFYVKIPAGNFGSGVPSLRGEGFKDVQVQKAADGSVISFRLQPGTAARVDQRSNRLDVVFSSSGRTGTENAQTASVAEQSPAVTQNPPPTLPSSTSSSDHREPSASPNQIEQPTSLNTISRENESSPQATADENTSKPAPSETLKESSNSSLAQSAASPDSSISITSQPQPSDTSGSQRLLVLGQAAQWLRGNWLVVLIALVPAALALLFLTYRRSKSEPIVPNEPEESDLSSSRTSNTEPVVLYPPTPDTTVGSPAAIAAAESSDELGAEPVHSVTEPVHSIPVSPETTTHATVDTQPTESVLHASHLNALITEQRLSDNAAENEQRERTEAEARVREEESRLAEEDAQVRAENEGRERAAAEARPREEARRAEEEAQMKAEEEERRRAEAEARLREQAEARLLEEETRRAEEQTRYSAERDARLGNEREILAGSEAEAIQRAEEDARFRMEAETLRRAAEELARRRAQAKAARVAEEEARRRAEEENRQRLAEEARRHEEEEAQRLLKAEAQRRAEEPQAQSEVEARRRATEERLKLEQDALMQAAIELTRRRAEVEEARRRAERETRLLAQEQARKEEENRRLAEEERVKLEAETERRTQEEKSRVEESRHRVENDRRRVEELNLCKAEEREHRLTVLDAMKKQAEEQARQRAAHEQRIRAEIEVLRQAELEQDRRIEAETRRRADAEARLLDEPSRRQEEEAIRLGLEETSRQDATEVEMHAEHAEEERELAQADKVFTNKDELSVPPVSAEEIPSSDNRRTQSEQESSMPPDLFRKLNSNESHERVVALAELAAIGGDDFFSFISRAFDDESEEVRNAAALALYNVQPDRAASFTRALREGSPERRQKIGAALATSGLANEAISNLTGDSREKTYDAFSLLFLMAKAGEVEPLMKAIDEHPSIEVRLAVVKLLALSGQAGILPEFRRLAVRGSLPSEVRAAVMDAIYQISSQAEESAHSAA